MADSACRHEFDLLGSGPYSFADGINWHLDFKSGFSWPQNLLHRKIRRIHAPGADIKVPWELNRFHHAVTLAIAWKCSGEKKYLEEVLDQIEDWVGNNPVGFGVNWACPMEVAIRSVNWLVFLAIVNDGILEKNCERQRLLLFNSLWEHACFLRTHMEWNGPKADSGANHLLLNLTGILTLGIFFKNDSRGKRLIPFAKEHLEKQMERQVFPDGVHFECSIGYHRLCLEAFLWCSALTQMTESPFSKAYCKRLLLMQKFVADYTKPNMKSPLIGDDDNGRLINIGLLPFSDHYYLLRESNTGTFFIDRFLLDGSSKIGLYRAFRSINSVYEDSGFYIFRRQSVNLLVRAGTLAFDGTHSHNDQLSYILSINCVDVFVDRGTCQYSSDPIQRNLFRSTAAHNSMQINELEQNRFGNDIFDMQSDTDTKVLEISENCLVAIHKGFVNSRGIEYQHKRRFDLNATNLTIVDSIYGVKDGDILHWYFHVAPGLNVMMFGNDFVVHSGEDQLCVLQCEFSAKSKLEYFAHSPEFGLLQDAERIHFSHEIVEGDYSPTFSYRILWD